MLWKNQNMKTLGQKSTPKLPESALELFKEWGREGGKKKTIAKARAARLNGLKGGRK
jgi:hypothetical protein